MKTKIRYTAFLLFLFLTGIVNNVTAQVIADPYIPNKNITITEVTQTSIKVSWQAATSPNALRVEDMEYFMKIRKSTESSFKTVIRLRGPSSSYTFTGLDPNTTYTVRITAGDGATIYESDYDDKEATTLFALITIATMKTSEQNVYIMATYTGTGKILANDIELKNNVRTSISAQSGSVTLKASLPVALNGLFCDTNGLTELDVSKCTDLENLSCAGNTLKSLNVSKCTKLISLVCDYNNLSTLDLSGCSKLTTMRANNQTITATKSGSNYPSPIDYTPISGTEKIFAIGADDVGAEYTKGDNFHLPTKSNILRFSTDKRTTGAGSTPFAGNIILEGYVAPTPPVLPDDRTLTVTNITSKSITISWNKATDDGGQANLEYQLQNKLSSYSGWNDNLWQKNVSSRTFINLAPNTEYDFRLNVRDADGMVVQYTNPLLKIKTPLTDPPLPVTTIVTMKTTKETVSIFAYNTGSGEIRSNGTVLSGTSTTLTPVNGEVKLEAVGSVKLEGLHCENNELTSLDVSGCTDLYDLYCYDNKLTNLNASGCTKLARIRCYYNNISTMDLSGCTSLWELMADSQEIFISASDDGYKNPISYTPPTGTENIKIDDVAYAYGSNLPLPDSSAGNRLAFTTTKIPATSGTFSGTITFEDYSLSAKTLVTMATTAESVDIAVSWSGAGNLVTNEGKTVNKVSYHRNIIVPDNGTISLIAYGEVNLTYLSCPDAKLTSLDLSNCPDIETVQCSNNEIRTLNLSGCSKLLYLNAVNQAITVEKPADGLTYLNPVSYTPPTGTENILINSTRYAVDAQLPLPATGDYLSFSTDNVSTIFDTSFSGNITLQGFQPNAINDIIAAPIIIYSTAEGIIVKNAPIGERIQVYNISGVLIVETQCLRLGMHSGASSETEIALPKGIYIVKVGNVAKKVIKN